MTGSAGSTVKIIKFDSHESRSEFQKDYDAILARAIISATAKAITQYALAEQNSSAASMASIFVAAYSFGTTAADVRIWTALPKEFQIARLSKPDDGKLKVTPAGYEPFYLEFPPCKNAIIYIKITTPASEPIVEVLTI